MALKYSIQGRVYVQFRINEIGQVCNVQAIRKTHKDLDREAVRVISQSSNWTPGYKNHKPIDYEFTFPINYVLE